MKAQIKVQTAKLKKHLRIPVSLNELRLMLVRELPLNQVIKYVFRIELI
jgi:hypothetical protein